MSKVCFGCGLVSITCFKCGILFSVPQHWDKSRHEDKESFYCPNGHGQHYTESTSEKLRRERDQLKQRQAQLEDEIRSEKKKHKAEIKRLQKREAAGLCPCCNRTFGNMAEHMKHMHPEFIEATGAAVIPIKRDRSA